MWPHQGACLPAEGAASGLQLAAVHHGGRPALVGRAAAPAGAPAAPRGPEGRPGRGVVRGALPVALPVPLRDEVRPLLCHCPAPAPLLPVHCAQRQHVSAVSPCPPQILTSRAGPSSICPLCHKARVKCHVKCPSTSASCPSTVQWGLAPRLRVPLVAGNAIHCGPVCAQHQALWPTAGNAMICVARALALG